MKERPILFSGAMVRAILSGQKTQTRRVVKGMALEWLQPGMFTPEFVADSANDMCPYGQPGDRLWIREAWNQFDGWQGYFYRADDNSFGIGEFDDPDHIPEHALKWKPSIHMPRAACRLVLEIVSVRVERLNDISEEDAIAEGIQCEERIIETRYEAGSHVEVTADMYHIDGKRSDAHYSATECFQSLWSSINGPESWDENPWVWVVEFKRVQQ